MPPTRRYRFILCSLIISSYVEESIWRTDASQPKDSLLQQHRHLDLRRAQLGSNIRKRSRVAHAARCYLHEHGTRRDFVQAHRQASQRSRRRRS